MKKFTLLALLVGAVSFSGIDRLNDSATGLISTLGIVELVFTAPVFCTQ